MRPQDISALDFTGLIAREWLATNGLGGYASSTLCGLNTRKYHGLLVAAMAPPVRRMVLLSHVDEVAVTRAGAQSLGANEYPGTISPQGFRLLRAFSAAPFPRWAYQGDGFTIEKSLHLLPGENTVCLTYALLAGEKSVALEVRPQLALRPIHELTYQWNARLTTEARAPGEVRIAASARTPEVFFAHDGAFDADSHWYLNTIYRCEEDRGYAGLEDIWNPGVFRWTISPGQRVHLVCAAEPVELHHVLASLSRQRESLQKIAASRAAGERDENLEALVHAAGAFVVWPRAETAAVSVIARYPWSGPNARSALAGFDGLFLVPGKYEQGRDLLRGLAAQIHDGLVPTEFSETGEPPKYSGADTSLWFVLAAGGYIERTGDMETGRLLFGAVLSILEAYRHGTRLGIRADHEGLVLSGEPGAATSWMDARVGDWVVTPRQGRTVELNALWFNALHVAVKLAARMGRQTLGAEYAALADSVYAAFNRRFWNEDLHCCFDVVEDHGADPSIRPNQILAVSLAHAVLSPDRHRLVVQKVMDELLAPYGLRSLSRGDPVYQGRYTGNVVSRDRAQHQGSVHPAWLGQLSRAFFRVHGRNAETIETVRGWLQPSLDFLKGNGVGQLCELFDGDAPHHPGGAIASALSVAGILRCYAQDVLGIETLRASGAADAVTAPGGATIATGRV